MSTTEIISTALIQSLWQDAIVALALWAALRALRRSSANVRYLVCCAGLMAMVAWPLGSAIPLVPPVASHSTSAAEHTPSGVAIPAATGIIRLAPGLAAGVNASSIPPLQRWALPVWIVGVMLFSLRAIGSGTHAVLLTRRATEADESLRALVADVARRVHVTRPVRIMTSPLTHGPATVGILRPVVLMPPAALLGLTPQQLEAVLAHELAHIRRYDFLVNIAQVLVETLFFYHPAIWWASRRIRIERELCCDDIAVRCCGEPLVYAQALTSIARLPIPSPRFVLGARTGPLVYRIHRVLGLETRAVAMSMWPPILAIGLVLACAAANNGWAQTSEPQRFEVVSVKPNRSTDLELRIDIPSKRRFIVTNLPLRNLIRFAYGFEADNSRLIGGPGWIDNERYDIVGTADRDIPIWSTAGPPPILLAMVRTLLAERFQLVTHHESREVPVFELVLARSDHKLGPRASASAIDCAAMLGGKSGPQPPPSSPSDRPQCGMRIGPGQMLLGGIPMSQFATVLASFARRPVIDRTGLEGNFNLELSWTPQGMRLGGAPPPDGAPPPPVPPPDPNGASLFVSIQEQLGLKLDASRALSTSWSSIASSGLHQTDLSRSVRLQPDDPS